MSYFIIFIVFLFVGGISTFVLSVIFNRISKRKAARKKIQENIETMKISYISLLNDNLRVLNAPNFKLTKKNLIVLLHNTNKCSRVIGDTSKLAYFVFKNENGFFSLDFDPNNEIEAISHFLKDNFGSKGDSTEFFTNSSKETLKDGHKAIFRLTELRKKEALDFIEVFEKTLRNSKEDRKYLQSLIDKREEKLSKQLKAYNEFLNTQN
nr:hypothetical protein [uncultured Cetobacterium sp.]